MKQVWIIEMQDPGTKHWDPTVGTALSRKDGQELIRTEWKVNHPEAKFRVARYVHLDSKYLPVDVIKSLASNLEDLLDALDRSGVRVSIATASSKRRCREALNELEDILPERSK